MSSDEAMRQASESRSEVASVALTPSEYRDIKWLAGVNETSVSEVIRSMPIREAVAEAQRKRAMLSA